MRLAELRELPLPPTQVAEGAWERARRHRRRTTVAGVALAVALVGSTAVGVGLVRDGDHPTPSPAPSPPTPSFSTPPTITDLPDFAALARTVPTLSPDDPTYLSADPVGRAVLAVMPSWRGSDAFPVVDVLGDDGRWRYVDVPGLVPTHDEGGYEGPALDPTSLSPDGTQLALPQPDRVVVVDLTTGEYRRYDLPGPHVAVVWQDSGHVVVTEEGAAKGRVVDLADGTVAASPYTASTGFAPDGSWVTWGLAGRLIGSDGAQVTAEASNDGGLVRTSPLVDEDVAVGLGGHDLVQEAMTYKGVAGIPVVDRHTGALRAFLYTEGPDTGLEMVHLLGLDGDIVTFAVGVSDQESQLLVLRWSWRTGEVTPVEVLKAGMISGSPE